MSIPGVSSRAEYAHARGSSLMIVITAAAGYAHRDLDSDIIADEDMKETESQLQLQAYFWGSLVCVSTMLIAGVMILLEESARGAALVEYSSHFPEQFASLAMRVGADAKPRLVLG